VICAPAKRTVADNRPSTPRFAHHSWSRERRSLT